MLGRRQGRAAALSRGHGRRGVRDVFIPDRPGNIAGTPSCAPRRSPRPAARAIMASRAGPAVAAVDRRAVGRGAAPGLRGLRRIQLTRVLRAEVVYRQFRAA